MELKKELSVEQIDLLHEQGRMPDWAWLQQNGRSPEENYNYIKKKIEEDLAIRRQAIQQEKEIDKQIEQRQKELLKAIAEQIKLVL